MFWPFDDDLIKIFDIGITAMMNNIYRITSSI